MNYLVELGHIQRKLSRYNWCAIQGAKFEAAVHGVKAEPLLQGGLEIPMKVTVKWSQKIYIPVLIAKVEEVNYQITGEYIDYSKAIFNEIGAMRKTRITMTNWRLKR